MDITKSTIAIIGLGYVGLPLAVEFGKKFSTIGFDINQKRIDELNQAIDTTLEVKSEDLRSAKQLKFSSNADELKTCNVYIVTVPTPINANKQPDLKPLQKASQMLGSIISKGDTVIYESTVFPGATEEVCIPIIEEISGLILNKDFFAGYSPERINPGDKKHTVTNILKVISGSTPEAAEFVDQLYASIITAGTYKTSSIKVAEAAKVIENTQRDVNIALINELALIFDRLDIDTSEVLAAAGTKWNFLPFKPGLVGGHCIGVDPYYLTHKAQEIGYHPEVILAGRRINDSMGQHVAESLIKLMTKRKIQVVNSKILILGFTFKENCPDIRNTRVIDIIEELQDYHVDIDIYDPWANATEMQHEYQLDTVEHAAANTYDGIILAVAHEEFKQLGMTGIRNFAKDNAVIYDVKHLLPADQVDGRL